ncbi:hypothetical protein [Paraburkholderia caffeinilytica]|uniref:hypothetical protein n=1 Tax=Paraburkholderia caffeinilytica TaxID=1761016 RepID=UPI0038BB2CF5
MPIIERLFFMITFSPASATKHAIQHGLAAAPPIRISALTLKQCLAEQSYGMPSTARMDAHSFPPIRTDRPGNNMPGV